MFVIIEISSATLSLGILRGIKHKKSVNILFKKGVMRHKMKSIQSKLHRIGTDDVCKISLLCFDDKRYISNDGINSLAYSHKDLRSHWEM